METSEKLKWPNILKRSVVFGIGLVAMEGVYIGLQVAGIVEPTFFENATGAVFGLAGGWRITEPFILMRELRSRNSDVVANTEVGLVE